MQGIEYKMSKRMFNAILGFRTEDEEKLNPYVFVTKYINDNFGLKGTVAKIIVD